MISERKHAANRRNSKKSRGPSTIEGRRRSSGNALKHGLSLPVSKLPELSQEVAAVVASVVRDYPHGDSLAVYHCAVAVVELRRCASVRDELYSIAVRDHVFDVPAADQSTEDPVAQVISSPELDGLAKIQELLQAILTVGGSEKKPLTVASFARQMKNLWRYESRAHAAFLRAAKKLRNSSLVQT